MHRSFAEFAYEEDRQQIQNLGHSQDTPVDGSWESDRAFATDDLIALRTMNAGVLCAAKSWLSWASSVFKAYHLGSTFEQPVLDCKHATELIKANDRVQRCMYGYYVRV